MIIVTRIKRWIRPRCRLTWFAKIYPYDRVRWRSDTPFVKKEGAAVARPRALRTFTIRLETLYT